MNHLTPCPACQRHVRTSEARCPFCEVALSLAHVPEPVLPRQRLGRAATFAFGASVVGATALVACGGDVSGKPDPSGAGGYQGIAGGAAYGAPPGGGSFGVGGGNMYGAPPNAGTSGAPIPLYGAPTAGFGGVSGSGGVSGAGGEAGGGGEGGVDEGVSAVYGAPPAGAGGI